MHRSGIGVDRGGHGGSAGGQGGYRRDYHRGYRQSEHNNYGNYNGGMNDAPRKYEHGGNKYDGGAKYDNNAKYEDGITKYDAGAKYERNNSEQTALDPMITSLEKRISSVQSEMNQALHDVTAKETEKFDLIFSILIELQRRQAQLEETVRALKAQLSPMCGTGIGQQPHMQHGGQQGQQHGQQHAPQQGQQMGGQMGQQMSGYMSGQMPMNQQYGNMVAADGSQAYFAPVVVAVPQNGPQTPYAVPQMMSPAGPMQPMPQQMAMQYVGQGQANEEYQWNGGSGAGTARSSAASQPTDVAPQESHVGTSENRNINMRIEEE